MNMSNHCTESENVLLAMKLYTRVSCLGLFRVLFFLPILCHHYHHRCIRSPIDPFLSRPGFPTDLLRGWKVDLDGTLSETSFWTFGPIEGYPLVRHIFLNFGAHMHQGSRGQSLQISQNMKWNMISVAPSETKLRVDTWLGWNILPCSHTHLGDTQHRWCKEDT